MTHFLRKKFSKDLLGQPKSIRKFVKNPTLTKISDSFSLFVPAFMVFWIVSPNYTHGS